MFDNFLDLFELDNEPMDEFQNPVFVDGDFSGDSFQNPVFVDGDVSGDGFLNPVFVDGDVSGNDFFNPVLVDDGVPADDFLNPMLLPDAHVPAPNNNLPETNGVLESEITTRDLFGDDRPEMVRYDEVLDRDGDGRADAWVQEQQIDFNADGIPEIVWSRVELDEDGDGEADARDIFFGYNLDMDGELDRFQVGHDYDHDGIVDEIEELIEAEPEVEPEDPEFVVVPGGVPTYIPFDPDNSDPDCVVGDPEEAIDSWHWQETNSSCAVAAQEFVLEILTGREFDESDLRDLAEEQGWYDPNGGTAVEDVGNILEHMGLHVERSEGNSIEDLERCLDKGGEVIVGVDSDELWNGSSDDRFGPGMDADHAIQVIGIDRTDPDQPMVIINDSGTNNGGGAMVPMDLFIEAWEDSGCFMVEAYA